MVLRCTKSAWYLVWLKVTWEPVLFNQLQIKYQHCFQQWRKKKNILLATPNFRWLVAIQCYSTPTKYPINSAIIHKEKFIHLVNGDIQNIDTIITCWTWVTWIWPFRSIPGCTVTCGSIGVGCCIIGSTMLCSRVLDDRVSRIDYSGNCCIEPNHWTMLCFKKWNVFVQKCK